MNGSKRWTALGAAMLMSVGSVATAETSTDVNAELSALKARIAELEGKQSQNWLNERRAEEVKGLIREVLADADTRASLLEGGLTAGHNGQNFFLASEDGGFLLTIGGQLDFRYYYNNRDLELGDDDDDDDEHIGGFQTGHTQLDFAGHVGSPRFGYVLRLALDLEGNEIQASRAYVTYAFSDNLTLWLGEREAPFLREELTENSYITAVERSVFNEIFTLGVVQGLGLAWDVTDAIKLAVSLNDGIRSGEFEDDRHNLVELNHDSASNSKPYDEDETDFAVTARVDIKLAGAWDQMSDFASWSGEEFAAFVGGAVHYEAGETGTTADNDNFWTWTIDGSIETNGLSVFGALVGLHSDAEDDEDIDAYGYLIEGAYNINDKWQPFVRYEKIHLEFDGFNDSTQFVTAGLNWFINKHRAKATFDVLWALDPVDLEAFDLVDYDATLLGLKSDSDDDADDQFVIRAKFQLMF